MTKALTLRLLSPMLLVLLFSCSKKTIQDDALVTQTEKRDETGVQTEFLPPNTFALFSTTNGGTATTAYEFSISPNAATIGLGSSPFSSFWTLAGTSWNTTSTIPADMFTGYGRIFAGVESGYGSTTIRLVPGTEYVIRKKIAFAGECYDKLFVKCGSNISPGTGDNPLYIKYNIATSKFQVIGSHVNVSVRVENSCFVGPGGM